MCCLSALEYSRLNCPNAMAKIAHLKCLKHAALQITVHRRSQLSKSTGSFKFYHTVLAAIVIFKWPLSFRVCRAIVPVCVGTRAPSPHPALIFIVPSSAYNQSTHPHTCHCTIHMLTSAH